MFNRVGRSAEGLLAPQSPESHFITEHVCAAWTDSDTIATEQISMLLISLPPFNQASVLRSGPPPEKQWLSEPTNMNNYLGPGDVQKMFAELKLSFSRSFQSESARARACHLSACADNIGVTFLQARKTPASVSQHCLFGLPQRVNTESSPRVKISSLLPFTSSDVGGTGVNRNETWLRRVLKAGWWGPAGDKSHLGYDACVESHATSWTQVHPFQGAALGFFMLHSKHCKKKEILKKNDKIVWNIKLNAKRCFAGLVLQILAVLV